LLSKSIDYVKKLFDHKRSTDPTSVLLIEKDKINQMQEIADLFVETGATKSKKDVRRQIEAGGVYVNNLRITKE
jgi:tyrosyl-tRNA synthetase